MFYKMGNFFHSLPSILVLPVLCAVSGGTAQEQIGSSCFSRPIKLRVNLAPQMIEGGATPVEKNFEQAICPRRWNYYIKRIITFLISARRRARRKASQGRGKTKISLRACACRPCPMRCIFSYSDYNKKDTSNHFPFNFVLSSLLNGRWRTKSLLWPVCIWKLVVFLRWLEWIIDLLFKLGQCSLPPWTKSLLNEWIMLCLPNHVSAKQGYFHKFISGI